MIKTLPKQENIISTIKTKDGFNFTITYNIKNNRYYLYQKQDAYYTKIASAENLSGIIHQIAKFEKECECFGKQDI